MSPPSSGESGFRSSLLAVALVAMLVTAGCSSIPGMGGEAASGSGPALDAVPEGSTAVFYTDVNGALNDDSMRTVLNGTVAMTAGPTADGTTSLSDVLARVENQSGLDMTALNGVTFFSKSSTAVSGDATLGGPSTEYAAGVIDSDWSEDEFVAALRANSRVNISESEYAGQPVYTSSADNSWLGVLGDGRFALGSESAVKDSLDASGGDAAAFDNDVRSAFESTTEGHLRYAASVPQDEFNASDIGSGSEYSTAAFNQVTTVSGSVATVSGGNLSLSANMQFQSESAATDARDVIDGAVTTYRGLTEDNTTERLLSENHFSVTLDGTEVTVTATNGPETYVTLFRTLFLIGAADASL